MVFIWQGANIIIFLKSESIFLSNALLDIHDLLKLICAL